MYVRKILRASSSRDTPELDMCCKEPHPGFLGTNEDVVLLENVEDVVLLEPWSLSDSF